MNIRKLSINKACVFLGVFLLLAAGFISAAVYVLTRNTTAVWYVLLFSLFVLLCVICFVALIRRKLAHFSDAFCAMLDDMLSGAEQPRQAAEEESLFYKINFRLGRLYEVMQEIKQYHKEQSDLQELISDISHQVKTPIANLKIINSTLMEQDVPAQKQRNFWRRRQASLTNWTFLCRP